MQPDKAAPLHVQEGLSTDWFKWFAWRPVKLSSQVYENPGYSYAPNGDWAWLKYIERRTFYAAPWFVIYSWNEYKNATQKEGI